MAAEELEGAQDMAPEPAGDEQDTITVPADTLPGCQAGDTYKVVSADENGIQLQHVGGKEEEDENGKWADDFRQHMSPKNPNPMSADLREEMS